MERKLAGLCVEQIVRLIARLCFSSKICCPYLVFYTPEVLSFLKINQSTHTTLGIRVIWFIEFIGRHSVIGALYYSALRLCNALPQCIKDIVKACKYISRHYLLWKYLDTINWFLTEWFCFLITFLKKVVDLFVVFKTQWLSI